MNTAIKLAALALAIFATPALAFKNRVLPQKPAESVYDQIAKGYANTPISVVPETISDFIDLSFPSITSVAWRSYRDTVAEECPREITEACMNKIYLVSDEALTRTYHEALGALSSTDAGKPKAEQLRSLQDAWAANREANCKFLTDDNVKLEHNRHGFYDCMAMATIQRGHELSHFIGD
jgi:uncharacterized protein YecT (DUF1311 family)